MDLIWLLVWSNVELPNISTAWIFNLLAACMTTVPPPIKDKCLIPVCVRWPCFWCGFASQSLILRTIWFPVETTLCLRQKMLIRSHQPITLLPLTKKTSVSCWCVPDDFAFWCAFTYQSFMLCIPWFPEATVCLHQKISDVTSDHYLSWVGHITSGQPALGHTTGYPPTHAPFFPLTFPYLGFLSPPRRLASIISY